MKWIFISDCIFEESNTHFCIQLVSGTWIEPLSIKIKTPTIMAHHDREKYLQLGLLHAKEFMLNRHKFTSEYSAAL